MSETTDEFLQHYGVAGMKWGKRSGGSSSGSSGSSGGKTAVKAERKAIRKDMYKGAAASMRANKGKTAAGAILAGGSVTVGVALARSAGHSKGKSLAIGLLGGAPGGLLAVNLAARKATKDDN